MSDRIGDPVNPFQPGFATTPPLLVGRDEWLAALERGMAQARSGLSVREIVFYGIRGMGKTALLDEFVTRARAESWAAVRVEAESGQSLLMTITAAAEQMSDQLPGGNKRAMAEFSSTLREVKVALGAAGVTAEVAATREPEARQASDVFERMIAGIATVAQRSQRGIGLFVDETQAAAASDLQTLFRALSKAHSQQLPVIVMFAGLPNTPHHVMDAVSYAERARFVELGPLAPVETAKALVVPIERAGLRIDPGAVSELIDLSGGFPYLVQLYGSAAWEVGADGGTITADHVALARSIVIQELDQGIYGSRWAAVPHGEQLYLAAMATLGDGWVPSGEVAARLGKTTREVSAIRQRLIERGMIQTASGTVAMQFPGYGHYVRYRMDKDQIVLPEPPREPGSREPSTEPPPASR